MAKKLLLTLFVVLIVLFAKAQQFHTRHISLRDGLPGNSVRAIYKDSKGVLWIGTDVGLCTYDGGKIKRIKLPSHLSSNRVWAIAEDNAGAIWFGTYGAGLLKYQNKEFIHIKNPAIPNNNVRVLRFFPKHNSMLVGTQLGFSSIDTEGVFSFVPDSLNEKSRFLVMGFIETARGIVFHTFNQGAFLFEPKSKQVSPLPPGSALNVRSSSATYVSSAGDTIIGVNKSGVRIINRQGVKEFHDMGQVFDIREDSKGVVWFSAWSYLDMAEPGGVFAYDGERMRHVSPSWGIKHKQGWCTYFDEQSAVIFVGTEGAGLYKVPDNGISYFPPSYFGLDKLEIYDIKVYKNQLWFTAAENVIYGTPDSGFRVLGQDFFQKSKLQKGHSANEYSRLNAGIFRSIQAEADSVLWIGSVNALFKLKNEKPEFTRFNLEGTFASNFHVFPSGKALSGTWNFHRSAHNVYETDSANFYSFKKEYPTDITRIVNREEEVWFGSNFNGLYRYKDEEYKWFVTENPALPRNISALIVDKFGKLICGTHDGRVLMLEGSDSLSIRHVLNEENGLHGTDIQWLLSDSRGLLWIGTNTGLNIVSLEELYEKGSAAYHYINEDEGFVEYAVRSAVEDANGIIWLGGVDYLVRIDPKKLLGTQAGNKRIALMSLKVNYIEPQWDSIAKVCSWRNVPLSGLVLDHKSNTLSFNFAVDNLLNPQKIQYSFLLKGAGNPILQLAQSSEVTFSNLPPGKYTVLVNAKNMHTLMVYLPLEFQFRIRPPWWKTWYFYIGLALLFAALVWSFLSIRIQRIKDTEQLKRDHEKRLNGIRMQAIQAQMNPHFVFNVLSSIQNFMFDNDMDSCLEYLNDFSVLIRKTMEHISDESVLLSEELDYLSRYIKLENLRMENSLKCKILISEQLKNSSLRIPPMLVQPFVENAIKHGLSPKETNRILCLSFFLENEALKVHICDNGIGMESSAKQNPLNSLHKSIGISNTIERINYLCEAFPVARQNHYGVNIFSRHTHKSKTGVRVEISLPLWS